jgi:uncharacterized protein
MKKILLSLFCTIFVYGALTFPKLTGRVVDEAGILSSGAKIKIESLLKSAENNSSNQVVVVTLKSLQGNDIADYGYQLGRYWGIGQKKLNNGVLLIVAPNERKVRIEVGYGLEGKLTDAISSVIINSDILPYFRRGDYDSGVINGVKAILSVLKGTYKKNSKTSKKDNFAPLLFFVFVFFVMFVQSVFSHKYKKITSKIIPSSFIGFFAYVFTASLLIGILIFILAFILFLFSNAFSGSSNSTPMLISGGDDFFDNGDSGFGSFGGGFSGGGGGFGGGGASGSW